MKGGGSSIYVRLTIDKTVPYWSACGMMSDWSRSIRIKIRVCLIHTNFEVIRVNF